ncbi:MAG: alpha-amylase family glycosyl hydrolase, partial [Chthoniobacteraceae bacterium]
MKSRHPLLLLLLAVLGQFVAGVPAVRGEAMLQYFNTDWRELTARIPEIAEAGYTSLWVPPPTKGSGGLSVGYDLWDRFDLGGKDQRGTVRTRYGTEADLQVMIETAHRFGIRVYFDNIMNHNSFDVPGYNASTPIDLYPGFLPEDFHLRITEDGFYRKWDNTRDWNSAWQVQNLGLADLIDIAIESPNTNHGRNEGDDIPKITFIRQPDNPEFYLDTDLPIPVTNAGGSFTTFTFANKEPWLDVGVPGVPGSAGNGRFDWVDTNANGQHDVSEASEQFTDTGVDGANPLRQTAAWGFGDGKYNMGNPVPEDVNALLIRSARWILDRTKADGYRLDAVKHVPDYFFGQQSGADKDRSGAGYLGQSQEQFNLSRGFSDWDNHRDSVFNTEQGRDDAMMFGEHLGQPPGYGGYWDSGMRLVDNDLRNNLNSRLGNPSNGLGGYDQPGWGGFAPGLGVTHAQSHDNDYAARRELQHAYYLTRAGLPIIYTDGNNHAGTLSQSGGAFPRLANTNFLGQYSDGRLPNLAYIHNHFARGGAELKVFDPTERIIHREQIPRFSDADYVAYERLDKRENIDMTDADAAVLLFMMNDNYASGQARGFGTSFHSGAYLYNYSTYGGGFYKYAGEMNTAVVPPGGYFAFSWRSPEEALGQKPLTILQNGGPTSTLTYERKDGRDGDKNFNPYGLPDTNATDYKYSITVPRVTSGANLSFIARTDGSAENILLSLDGGVDVNSHIPLGPTTGEKRDNPPGVSNDVFLGYEQMQFVRRVAEKFAAVDTARNVIGSSGAETYRCTIGAAGFTNDNGAGTNSNTGTAAYLYHDPAVNRDIGGAQFSPAPQSAAGEPITVRVKSGYQFQIDQVWLYYTTDGSAPEGSAGVPKGTASALAMDYTEHGNPDGANITDWWAATLPALPNGTVLRYKVGGLKAVTASVFPTGPTEVALKKRMETVFQITGFNATAAKVRPHNDYSEERTGLAEGFHVARARAFLQRPGRASIYNTFTQTFYYDTQTPGGEIKFPAANGDTVGGQQYGVVVRADPSVTEVWYNITDTDPSNNDSATGVQGGNGSGPEPFTDSNRNGIREANEPFTDINGNGAFDANLAEAWVKVGEVSATGAIASQFGREWRFNYR